ncbi:MAG TPA: hypothetical protein VHI51_21515, partial [Ktedonobacterales bacterium]|nr:hypothetical protein [Ktedonobacterales bacterium]
KQALGILGHSQVPNSIAFTSALIDQPPRELAERIKGYARSHAPAGWDSPLFVEFAEDEDEGATDAS